MTNDEARQFLLTECERVNGGSVLVSAATLRLALAPPETGHAFVSFETPRLQGLCLVCGLTEENGPHK